MAYKGRYKPKHPKKYKGNVDNIIWRSTWERKCMKHFDNDPNVLWWSSEEMFVPYISPKDKKPHRYFPDFIIRIRNAEGVEETIMIEVKPERQTKEPVKQKKNKRRYFKEAIVYSINQAKWKYAEEYCKKHGWRWQIMTEKDLGIKR